MFPVPLRWCFEVLFSLVQTLWGAGGQGCVTFGEVFRHGLGKSLVEEDLRVDDRLVDVV